MTDRPEPLELPPSLRQTAERLASEDGVPLSTWVAMAVAQKIGAVETAADFFKRRSQGGSPERLKEFLAGVPDREPDEWDRLD